jgi:hypothetical protein
MVRKPRMICFPLWFLWLLCGPFSLSGRCSMGLLRRCAPRNDRTSYLVLFNSHPEINLHVLSLRARRSRAKQSYTPACSLFS